MATGKLSTKKSYTDAQKAKIKAALATMDNYGNTTDATDDEVSNWLDRQLRPKLIEAEINKGLNKNNAVAEVDSVFA